MNMGSTKEQTILKEDNLWGSFNAQRRECPWGLNNTTRFLQLYLGLKDLAPASTARTFWKQGVSERTSGELNSVVLNVHMIPGRVRSESEGKEEKVRAKE